MFRSIFARHLEGDMESLFFRLPRQHSQNLTGLRSEIAELGADTASICRFGIAPSSPFRMPLSLGPLAERDGPPGCRVQVLRLVMSGPARLSSGPSGMDSTWPVYEGWCLVVGAATLLSCAEALPGWAPHEEDDGDGDGARSPATLACYFAF